MTVHIYLRILFFLNCKEPQSIFLVFGQKNLMCTTLHDTIKSICVHLYGATYAKSSNNQGGRTAIKSEFSALSTICLVYNFAL